MTILESLILRIKAVINSNGTQAIRGDNLQNTLVDIAQTTDRHFAYKNGDPDEEFAAKSVITGEVRSENYTGGAFGEGYRISTDAETGESTAIFHNIVAKNGITAPMFTVRMMAATGGIDVTSAANAKLTNVVDGDDYWQCFYKCAGQLWKPLDQARIQSEFGGFLWGLVTAVSEQPNDRGEYSFSISKTTVANGSNTTPKLDDVVVLYGHRGADKYRQSLFIKSCGVDNPDEDYEPYEAKYVAINSFSLPKSKCIKWDGLTFDIAVNSFSIRGRDGNLYQQPNDRGGHVSGTTYYAFDRVSRDGSVWQCVVDSTTTTPSDGVSDWVCVVPKGSKGDYSVQGYCWAEGKPARPVGSSPEGWSAGSDRGVAIVDGSSANNSDNSSANSSASSSASSSDGVGSALTDESGVVLLEPYPANYHLWGSAATFDAETGEVVGEWSDPYQMTAEDGKDASSARNLIPRSGVEHTLTGSSVTTYIPTITTAVKGEVYTIAVDYITHNNTRLRVLFPRTSTDPVALPPAPTRTTKHVSITVARATTTARLVINQLAALSTDTTTIYSVMLVKGEVAPSMWVAAPEDVQGEIATAKQAAKEDMAKGAGYANWAALQAAAEAGSTIIKGGHVNTDLIDCKTLIADNAFINDLIVSKLRTTGGQVEITDSKQKFGNMEVDQGKVVVNGANGRRVELWSTNLTESNAISGGGTVPTAKSIVAMSATSDGVSTGMSSTIVSRNSVLFPSTVGLGFNCTIVGEVSPSNGGSGRASLYVVSSTGQKELITTLSAQGGVINERIVSTMPLGGSVKFLIEAEASNTLHKNPLTGQITVRSSTTNVAATTFNFTSDINRLILAPNGYAVVNGSNDYVIMATGIKKIVSPYYDAPGTLLWAGWYNDFITYYNGGKKHNNKTIEKLSQGVYRIHHSIGHTKYGINVAIESTTGWCGMWHWKNKTTTSIDIVISDMTSAPQNRNFDVTLTGNNTNA